jgi:perosamine synthetase
MIPYGKQSVDSADINAVVSVLKSDYLTSGSKIEEFEKKLSQFVGSKYAVVVANGTAALHLACLAAGLKKNDKLITSPLTFAASANCALYCGAKPIFVDTNEQGLIDERLIPQKITKKTKIIIPVHYAGLPCHMVKISKIAQKHKLVVIEDACHALGAKYKKSKIGDCRYSDMTVFSFHPVKHITTGEGGAITTNSKILYEKLLLLRTHGITKDVSKFEKRSKFNGDWYQEMQLLGYNYRLTDIQCALGISQLKKINRFLTKRRNIAGIYDKAFKNLRAIKILMENKNQHCSYHLYPIRVRNSKIRLKLFNFLKKRKIFCQVHYLPVYCHPYYQKLGYKKGICPTAEKIYDQLLSLPIFPGLKKQDLSKIIKSINDFYY